MLAALLDDDTGQSRIVELAVQDSELICTTVAGPPPLDLPQIMLNRARDGTLHIVSGRRRIAAGLDSAQRT